MLPQGSAGLAVALLLAAGDVADAVRPLSAEKVRHQAGGGDSVHIVIAKYRDFLPPGQGKLHPPRCQRHIRHQERVGQRAVTAQVFPRPLWVTDASAGQHHGGQGGISAPHQGVHRTHLRLGYIPNSVFQSKNTSNKPFSLYYSKKLPPVQ